MITGTTNNSRLGELRKYVVSGNFVDLYIQSFSSISDGLNPILSQVSQYPYTIMYYIGSVIYTDIIQSDGTSVTSFKYQPNNNSSFINHGIIKNPNMSGIINNPKIIDDVFIIRDNLSALDKNYRLEYIGNLSELTTYAGGKYFNIINNT